MQKLTRIFARQHKTPIVSDVKTITVQNHAYFLTRNVISVRIRNISQKYANRSRNLWNRIRLKLYPKHPVRTLLITISSQFAIQVSNKPTPPITIFITTAHQKVSSEVNTVASANIISWDTLLELKRKSCFNLSSTVSKMRTYFGKMVSSKGKCDIELVY